MKMSLVRILLCSAPALFTQFVHAQCTSNKNEAVALFKKSLGVNNADKVKLRTVSTSGKAITLGLANSASIQLVYFSDGKSKSLPAVVCRSGNGLVAKVQTGIIFKPEVSFLIERKNNLFHVKGYQVNSLATISK